MTDGAAATQRWFPMPRYSRENSKVKTKATTNTTAPTGDHSRRDQQIAKPKRKNRPARTSQNKAEPSRKPCQMPLPMPQAMSSAETM